MTCPDIRAALGRERQNTLLADGFAELSTASRRMRFLRPKGKLSQAELRYFTEAGHHGHEALGALDDRAAGPA
jgi:hypothetical protein